MATDGEHSSEDLNDLRKWVSAEALKIDSVEKYDLKIYAADDKAEHYGSSIAFVDISVKHFNGKTQEYNLVIKYGHRNQAIREKLPVREAFKREIDVYAKLIPCYHRFQREKNLPLFACAPKCYTTNFTDTEEVIILENLKHIGYKIHDRKIPMNLDHMKVVLKAYAEWHALSFALQDQRDQEYLEIVKSWTNNPMETFTLGENGNIFNMGRQRLFEVLEEFGEIEVLQKYKEKMGNTEAKKMFIDLLNKPESQSVVLHGDCWNNNFMFKYEDTESTKQRCTNVALLDFQITSVRSPVFDITYFIYAVASTEQLKHFRELIDYYYNHFANYMRMFGSNPEKIFPFSDLILHLQKYSIYGAILNTVIVLFTLVEKENAPDFGKENSMESLKTVAQNKEFRNRVVAVAKHLVEFEFI